MAFQGCFRPGNRPMTQSIAPLRPVRRQAGAWLAAAGAAALMAAAAPALADVHWVVSGPFDDGG